MKEKTLLYGALTATALAATYGVYRAQTATPGVDLILVSRKTIEVRCWPTDNGGRLWTPAFGWKSCW